MSEFILRDKIANYLEFLGHYISIPLEHPAFWGVVKREWVTLNDRQMEELEDLMECAGAMH